MAQKPLEILKKGLTKFSKKIKERKDALEAKLARKETISADDEHWHIYQSVMDAVAARENIEINGGDDVDDDINTSHEPPPTRRDVLKAISTIGKYTDDMNDPIARKMEAILGTFTRQLRLDETRTMKNSVLTDFFDLT
ncbi:hypothetical protein K443DRAFT_7397 [Laccaria amethystina LaAM-08-1]|uniref:Uncharacterized protein n=1 Tax=Laccaria amethystina LaAM-08-1 TaxID=1095629 RepID=A0A0C9X6X9_9AGAR|nr:hypothetical protein K443DRAFT_7397 [Laccaria amethystina LaAM-08-1]